MTQSRSHIPDTSEPPLVSLTGPGPATTTLKGRIIAWVTEFIQFGLVGALAFIVDFGTFNLLQHGPLGVLHGHSNAANVISATVATIFSWVMNRLWTYRGRTQDNAAREALLFAVGNIGGLLITQFCLLFTHEVLGLRSALADNIAAYIVAGPLADRVFEPLRPGNRLPIHLLPLHRLHRNRGRTRLRTRRDGRRHRRRAHDPGRRSEDGRGRGPDWRA